MIDVEKLAHDLAIVALSQRLAVEFEGKPLDEGQIYGLYQECFILCLLYISPFGIINLVYLGSSNISIRGLFLPYLLGNLSAFYLVI